MSVPFYPFYSLPHKIPNKGMDFLFTLLKLPNKGREEYSKIIIFIPIYSIPFPPPKWGLGFLSFSYLWYGCRIFKKLINFVFGMKKSLV